MYDYRVTLLAMNIETKFYFNTTIVNKIKSIVLRHLISFAVLS